MIRILSIDNLSGAAYRLATPDLYHSLRFETPARIHELVAGGHFDAALLPVASLPHFRGRVVPLGPYGIGCRGPVQSVQLFSGTPLGTLLHNQVPIYATPKSRTSVALLRVLCQSRYGVDPVFTEAYPRAAAQLLIGDAAYEFAHTHDPQEHDIDLGAWWFEETGLPFVFARWVVSPRVETQHRAALNDWLAQCADEASGPEGLARLADQAPAYGTRALRRNYYKGIETRLDLEALMGLNLFLETMKDYSNEPAARIA